LPRWADEGACTTVEHSSERLKQEQWLVRFLKTERGIPFNHMFAMREYPGDILPLYSQGYSLARYLIAQGGKPKFVNFVGAGLSTGDWTAAVRKFYGYESLGQLQLHWLDWVVDGSKSPAPTAEPSAIQLAAATTPNATARSKRTQAANGSRGERPQIDRQLAMIPDGEFPDANPVKNAADTAASRSWYARRQTESLIR
jgi:hypothetical protein